MAEQNETPDAYREDSLSSLPAPFELIFQPGGKEEDSKLMHEWLEGLILSSQGKLSIIMKDNKEQPFPPYTSLQVPGLSPVYYHFIPQGKETAPFLKLLHQFADYDQHRTESGESLPARNGKAEGIEMFLFVSIHCPNCPVTVSIIHSFAATIQGLTIHIFDIMQHPELAEEYHIQSVPTLIIEKKLRYVGTLPKERLLNLLLLGDHQSFVQEEIRQMIEQGKAAEAGNLIAEGNNPAFLKDDLRTSTFQTRLGILLALEEALEINPRSLDPLVKPLLPFLESEDAALRGDLADLLGKIGHQDALPALKMLCQDPDQDVAEAAEEALEIIMSK